jgi:hypothetical protein
MICSTPLQPKSGFFPEAGRGRPNLLEVEDGANETGQSVSRPLSRPSPTANLAGNWKGDPLIREVRGLKFTRIKCYGVVAFIAAALRIFVKICKIMLDVIYIGTAVLFFAAFALYAVGCEKL